MYMDMCVCIYIYIYIYIHVHAQGPVQGDGLPQDQHAGPAGGAGHRPNDMI